MVAGAKLGERVATSATSTVGSATAERVLQSAADEPQTSQKKRARRGKRGTEKEAKRRELSCKYYPGANAFHTEIGISDGGDAAVGGADEGDDEALYNSGFRAA